MFPMAITKHLNGKKVSGCTFDKIFNQKLKDGEFPQESLLYDENGNADESKLEEHSNKNTNKKGTTNPQPVKKTTPTPAPVPPKKKTGGGAQK